MTLTGGRSGATTSPIRTITPPFSRLRLTFLTKPCGSIGWEDDGRPSLASGMWHAMLRNERVAIASMVGCCCAACMINDQSTNGPDVGSFHVHCASQSGSVFTAFITVFSACRFVRRAHLLFKGCQSAKCQGASQPISWSSEPPLLIIAIYLPNI